MEIEGFEVKPLEIADEMDLDEDAQRIVDSLFSFNVLYMSNSSPDVSVIECDFDFQVGDLCLKIFGQDTCYQQIIVNNMCPDTNSRVPYFRVIMTDFDPSTAINYKLQSFYKRIRMPTLNARCSRAIVVGLASLYNLDAPLSIPLSFRTTSIEPLQFQGEIDVSCMKAIGKLTSEFSLNEIAGLCMPLHLPDNVQALILSYCRSPTAQLIVDKIDDICLNWDAVLSPMFLQREPRIPVHLASTYNAATVNRTIRDVTRPFLVPHVRTRG